MVINIKNDHNGPRKEIKGPVNKLSYVQGK